MNGIKNQFTSTGGVLSLEGILLGCLLVCCLSEGLYAAPQALLEDKDGWRVSYDPASTTLECVHPASKTRLAGPISFVVDSKATSWSIQPARDQVPQRLALVDEHNDAQGYLALTAVGPRLELRAIHRPPQLYAGQLHYNPVVQFGDRAFACRTRIAQESPVIQMASGPADSRLNDSLFRPEHDLVLRFDAQSVAITTSPSAQGQAPAFEARLTASILPAESSAISLQLLPDYYRSRYVPNYHLINRKRCPTAPTGWMSWNVYFDRAGEKENLDEARVGAKYLKPFGLEIWSIESWQDNSPHLPVSNFHNLTLRPSSEKFPHGMKWLAEQIRSLGFRPGLWTVPWGTGDEKFYQTHRGWFLHGPDGKPLLNWNGRYVLDPSQTEVVRHMEETHRVMSSEWGYEFFKIDGMSGRGPSYSAHFFERADIRAAFQHPMSNPYVQCVEALRRGIGPNRIFLACQGHYTGPDVAVADAGRMGADIVECNHPPHWANYLNQARISQSQLFVHNLVWYNDPDTLLVGAAPLNEVRLATTVVALPGQVTFFGDKLAELPIDRMRLLQQSLPVCDTHALDLAPVSDLKAVWDLKIRRPFGSWDVVSLFNWTEAPRELRCTFASLGLDDTREYLIYDFWNRQFLGAHRGSFAAQVGSHANLLLAVHAETGHPQFVSTDRHVCQGAVELSDEAWDQTKGELTCKFKLVENDPLTAVIYQPAGSKFLKAQADGATLENVSGQDSPTVAVVLRRTSSGEGKLIVSFKREPVNR